MLDSQPNVRLTIFQVNMNKYKIGEKYWLKVFLEMEEMEYLGEIKTKQLNGSDVDIKFQVFRRFSYGQPDLIATYNGEFFTRSYDDTVEGLTKAVGDGFRFEGVGYKTVLVSDVSLTIQEFKEQTKDLLSQEEIEKVILGGVYYTHHKNGEIKWCPTCQKIRQTSCCACGCGSCKSCGYRWTCMSPPAFQSTNLFNSWHIISPIQKMSFNYNYKIT